MSLEYFKCLICHKYFEDLCKVDSHNQKHTKSQRKRGIPVQALTFLDCQVVLQRYKQEDVPVKIQPISNGSESINLSPEVATLGNLTVRKCRLKKRKIINETESDEEPEVKNKRRPSKKRPGSDLKKSDLQECSDPEKTKICPIQPCAQLCSDYYRLLYHLKLHCKAERKEDLLASGKKSQLGKGEYTNPFYVSKTFFCKVCMKPNPSYEDLQSHLEKAHSTDKIECPYCQEDFGISALKLMTHMRAIHRDKLYQFEDKRKSDQFKCDKCHYTTLYKARLDGHKKRMHEKVPKLASWTESFLKKCQEDESYKKRPWPCLVCPARFNLKRSLQLHFVIHLETRKAQHVCDYSWCGRTYSHRRGLANHLKVVHAGKGSGSQNKAQTYQIPNSSKQIYFTNNSEAPEVQPQLNIQTKTEVIDEIHLIDKIILKEDGEAVHLKGECLTPLAPEISDDCRLEQETEETDEEAQNKKAALLALLKDPNIPIEDTIFSKIAEKDLTARLLIEKLKAKKDPKLIKNKSLPFKCSECNLEVKRAWRLQYHMKKVHKKTKNEGLLPSGQVLMMCGKCAYMAKDKADLDKHMKLHKSRRGQKGLIKADYQKTKCGICGDNFSNPENLRRHIDHVHMDKEYKKKNRRAPGNDKVLDGEGNADNDGSILGM